MIKIKKKNLLKENISKFKNRSLRRLFVLSKNKLSNLLDNNSIKSEFSVFTKRVHKACKYKILTKKKAGKLISNTYHKYVSKCYV